MYVAVIGQLTTNFIEKLIILMQNYEGKCILEIRQMTANHVKYIFSQ